MTLAGFIFSAGIAIRLTAWRGKPRHEGSQRAGIPQSAVCLENQLLTPLMVAFKGSTAGNLLVLLQLGGLSD